MSHASSRVRGVKKAVSKGNRGNTASGADGSTTGDAVLGGQKIRSRVGQTGGGGEAVGGLRTGDG